MRTLVLALGLSHGGCVSQTGLGRAETLPRGESQVGFGLEAQVIAVNSGRRSGAVPIPWAELQAGYHRGVGERSEAGVRFFGLSIPRIGLSAFGLALDGKYQIRRVERGWDASIATSLGYQQVRLGTPWHYPSVTASLLLGHDLGRHAIVLGPRLGYAAWVGEGQTMIDIPFGGAFVAFDFEVTRSLHLGPELVVLWSPISLNGESFDADRFGATSFQLGLGGAFEL